jgi:hypothetical protein
MTETAAKRSPEEIEAILVRHTGSLKRYRHWTGRFIYTPGVRDLAELCAASWLNDLIASHQIDPKVRAEAFQVWTLNVAADRTATATAADGNDRVIVRQEIEFTDFPLAEIKLYLTDGVLLLPSEY